MKRFFAISFFLLFLSLLKGQDWGGSDVAYMIYDIDSSRVVADSRANIKMTPASVLKLVATASALEVLGPESRITTLVTTDGTIDSQGVLNGNLYVRGALDPTVESAYFDNVDFFVPLIDSLKSAGINTINGDIVVDGSIVNPKAVSAKWVLEDLATYYGVGCYGISAYDNVQKLRMKSAGVGQGVTFSFQYPEYPSTVIDHIVVGKGTTSGIALYAMPYGNEVLVEGSMKKNSSWSEPLAISNPVRFFSVHLARRLRDSGITVTGLAREGKATGDSIVYRHYSPMLFHIASVTNFRSNNHYAQHLFQMLAANGNATFTDAVSAVKSLWRKRGVDLSDATFCDGNGLSPFNAVTAQQIVGMLNYMWRSDNGYFFFHTLPLCGKDGTVAKVFADSPMYIRAKSGSMSGIQSYAGYIVSKGRCYSFCIFVNKFSSGRQHVRSLIEQTITSEICRYEDTL